MKRLLRTTTVLTGMAIMPFAAHAALITNDWNGATDSLWTTTTNWTDVGTSGAPVTTSTVTINNTNHTPVQITTAVHLDTTATSGATPRPTGSLTIGAAETLNLTSTGSLTMGTHALTLNGGSITGTGSVVSAALTGFGTIAAPFNGTLNASGGVLHLQNSATVSGNNTGATVASGATLSIDTGATLNLNNGNATLNTNAGGAVSLNGGTLNGVNGTTFSNYLAGTGPINVTANSNLSGTFFQHDSGAATINIGGANGAHTLTLQSVDYSGSGGNAFTVGAGGILSNTGTTKFHNSNFNIAMQGGSFTNTLGATFNDSSAAFNGYGTVSGMTSISGSNSVVNANGGTLTFIGGNGAVATTLGSTSGVGMGFSTSGLGNTLDLQGNYTIVNPVAIGPGAGTINLDGVNMANASTWGVTMGAGTGAVVVTNASTIAGNVASNGNLMLNAALTDSGNLTLAKGSTLTTGSNTPLTLTGNYSYQQTDTVHAWTYNGTSGLGPDLNMNGGTALVPETLATAQTLEVGGIDEGNTANGFLDNFALNSLTIGPNAYVELVDQYANATISGWKSGSEALYLNGLFDGVGTATLNLNGFDTYLQGYGQLHNGLYTDLQGDQITIIGARAQVPEPASLAVLGVGLLGLGMIRRRQNQTI